MSEPDPLVGSTRGLLYPQRLPTFDRVPAPAAIADRVRWFWVPQWSLEPGRVSRQQVLPFATANLVVEPTLVGFAGPATRLSVRELTGTGWAVGALLQPAAVPALVAEPGALRDAYPELELPALSGPVRAAMSSPGSWPDAVAAFAAWVASSLPPADQDGLLANRLCELAETDASIVRVEELAEAVGVSVRTVQRLARRYVGLPPLALIRRRRLQEAAELLRADPTLTVAAVAARFGYADQAHLATEFAQVLGFTPSGYRRSQID